MSKTPLRGYSQKDLAEGMTADVAAVAMMLGKHAAMFDWSPRECSVIRDFILTTSHGIAEEMSDPVNALNSLALLAHAANEKWWIDIRDGVTRLDRNKGELIALMHSELSECLEGERKDLMDDKLPHRKMAEVELVDTLIRIFDYAGAFGYNLSDAFREKMAFNAQREDHKHEARAIAGGKQF